MMSRRRRRERGRRIMIITRLKSPTECRRWNKESKNSKIKKEKKKRKKKTTTNFFFIDSFCTLQPEVFVPHGVRTSKLTNEQTHSQIYLKTDIKTTSWCSIPISKIAARGGPEPGRQLCTSREYGNAISPACCMATTKLG